MVVSLRLADVSDADFLLSCRNQPETVANSNGLSIGYKEHLSWLKSVLADHQKRLFIVLDAGMLAGSVRIDNIESGVCEISIGLISYCQCRGIGGEAVKLLVDYAGDTGWCWMVARVKKRNVASVRLFENNGFLFDHEELGGVLYYRKKLLMDG